MSFTAEQLRAFRDRMNSQYRFEDPDEILDLGELIIRRYEVVAAWEENYKGCRTWVKFRGGGNRSTPMPLQEVRRIVFGEREPAYFATSVCTQGLTLKETK